MANVYILFSEKLDKFYIGSCLNIDERLEQHKNKSFKDSYTTNSDDWKLFLNVTELDYSLALKIEQHIKKMKSKIYIQNLQKHPEIIEN